MKKLILLFFALGGLLSVVYALVLFNSTDIVSQRCETVHSTSWGALPLLFGVIVLILTGLAAYDEAG